MTRARRRRTEPAVTPVGGATQELRLAPVMVGGVSLAIWMGGVTRELNLLQRASSRRATLARLPAVAPGETDANAETIYLRLLDLLDMTVDVDVLAGTSAGGINAALLGLARVNDIDLATLRERWVKLGAFETLLRDPKQDDPPSLLQGDDKLLKGLQETIDELWSAGARTAAAPVTRVHLTTTLIAGETSRFTDAYGTLVQDVSHHGRFRFDERQLAEPCVRGPLATAARSTASFPFAFEPGFVALEQDGDRPAMKRYANITRAHWVTDGGLLMNRPIQLLLQDIFDRPAERHVRRVLLYVIPSAGEQPDPRTTPAPVRLDEPLSLGDALRGDVRALAEQSIASDLRAFRAHNDRVDSLCDTRLRMAALGLRLCTRAADDAPDHAGTEHLRIVDAAMLDDFRTRQSDWFIRPVIASLMRDITSRPETELPELWRKSLAIGRAIEEKCSAKAANRIAAAWKVPCSCDAGWYETLEAFGLAAFEGAKATVITMLRSAYALTREPEDRRQLGRTLKRVHGALPAFQRPDVDELVREAVGSMLASPAHVDKLPAVAAKLAQAYWDALQPEAGALAAAWAQIAEALHDARGDILERVLEAPLPVRRAAAEPLGSIRRDRPSRERAAIELRTYVEFLDGPPERVAVGLFDLHVATRSVLPVAVDVEQPVEFVQLSADSRTLLSGRQTASEKLTGRQLHDFGAFYKSSWRANDWTWGRIDGSGWLVHLLLDPRRIETVVDAGPERARAFYEQLRQAIALPGATQQATEEECRREATLRTQVLAELKFLDRPKKLLPKSLPMTSQWVAREVQRWIACAELPAIARETVANPSRRVDPWAAEVLALAGPIEAAQVTSLVGSWERARHFGRRPRRAFVELFEYLVPGSGAAGRPLGAAQHAAADVRPVSVQMGELLRACTVPDETLERELGEPLLTRTVAKTAAVAGAIAAAAPQPIALLRPVLTTLRTITMAGYRAVTATGGQTTPLLLTGAAALVVGALLAISDTSLLGLAGSGLVAIGFYVIAITTWGRSRKAVKAFVAGLAIAGLLALGAGRRALFGNATCSADSCSVDDIGWFGREALPWLASSFWNVMLVVVAVFGLAAILGAVTTRRRATRAAAPAPRAAR